nr:L,D-transpeptidase family protein [uncultured Schaedlerella sp.]
MSTKKDNRKTGEASRKKKSALTRKPSAGRKSISRKKPAAGQKQSLKQKQTSGQKVFLIVSAAAAGCLCIVYLCVSFYFMKHFFPHTTINGQDISGQTAEAAETFFKEQTESYSLTVIENENRTETIRGSEISLTCMEMDEIRAMLKKQNAFGWLLKLWSKKSSEVQVELSYDRAALEKRIQSLGAVTAEQIPASSACPKYEGNTYVIEPESYGTAVNINAVKECITNSVQTFAPEVDLKQADCYETPKYTSQSEKVTSACETLNTCCRASITYNMDVPVVVDKALISTWLSVDGDMNVTLNEAAVREWMREFGKRYDTLGSSRTFTTPSGKSAEVSGGTYGWSVDEDRETALLIEHIKKGEVLAKEPAWCQRAAVHGAQDWGSTYIDVDLSAQHMWYVVNGGIGMQCDVVTGAPEESKTTPAGVYYISEKQSPSVLIGEIQADGNPEYEQEVDYWMRVTQSGIGFHDADWQPAFGGDLYLSRGSHGCINMSKYDAQTLYSMIDMGVPVVIHY